METVNLNESKIVEIQANSLLDQAKAVQTDQERMLAINSAYTSALSNMIDAKQTQMARIESQLESLIEDQSAKLGRTHQNSPGLLSKPGSRALWQGQVQQQQARLTQLHTRLDQVRDIEQTLTATGHPKIEALAAKQLQRDDPLLVKLWEDMTQAQRLHNLTTKKSAKAQPHQHRGITLGLIQPK